MHLSEQGDVEMDIISPESTLMSNDRIEDDSNAHFVATAGQGPLEAGANTLYVGSGEQPSLHRRSISSVHKPRKRRHRHLEWLVRLWVPKTAQEFERVKLGNYVPNSEPPYLAARTAVGCFAMFIIHTVFTICRYCMELVQVSRSLRTTRRPLECPICCVGMVYVQRFADWQTRAESDVLYLGRNQREEGKIGGHCGVCERSNW